jgi:hypothetical protein
MCDENFSCMDSLLLICWPITSSLSLFLALTLHLHRKGAIDLAVLMPGYSRTEEQVRGARDSSFHLWFDMRFNRNIFYIFYF